MIKVACPHLSCPHLSQTQKEIDKIRNSINRQAPLGNENWVIKMAKKHGLLSTLKARGRPKNKKKL